jgi:glycosyltransferase involved in cell wall biosynthesis
MKIGIFAPMTGRQAGGPESYDRGLVQGLAAVDPERDYAVYCVNRAGAALLDVGAPNVTTHVLQPRQRWINIPVSLPAAVWKGRLDLVHATFVAPPFLPAPLVFTLLDVSPVTHPQFLPWALRMRLWPLWRNSIRAARFIICISEFTRRGLIEAFGYPEDRAFVTHLGVHDRYAPTPPEATAARLARYGLRGPYVLHVGKLQARKNIVRLLEAFHLMKRETGAPHVLALVGRKTWTSDDVQPTIDRLGLAPHIVHLGHVDDEDTPYLYSGASVLAYPSLYEGFGLPVIEAMACGTPVVTSDTTSLPEVAGGAALLVDPYRVESIAEALRRVVTDEALAASMRARGIERARAFTWENTARRTIEVYRRVRES